MDKKIPMHKEIAMGLKGAQKEPGGKTDTKKVVKNAVCAPKKGKK